ncbi:chemotaxis protein CheY [Pseudothermotoga hypogea DSM 11164 = NBRC 106472]|uniref:Chemotaxis protein CheY n=1 Tax=Pseudothermotoga hypogea DSM 11164 = NBRC 106472 TaxID=1123384 RepID=A0A0X1KNZ3_9THEM|nr:MULTISPECIES: CheY-P phosphatase CheC [Pseudothermotoga]AJC72972.1 chemotaxis protein CheY [Pseudothermotoga hypogea DSM 11164 = NBRC 106472]MBC7123161.1 chemotaxis protein CheC [Pseudothermotoga sp.]MDI6862352.1 CheY-P phosphatase CheC [Pseudothermotoga sp.]
MILSEKELDLLKEIGNIGTGNAATALSQLTNKKVEITVPKAEVVPISKIPFIFPEPEDLVVGVRMSVHGDINFDVLLVLNRLAAKRILQDLLGSPCEDVTQLDELSQSALKEVGNIMCGSYITALAEFTGLYLDPLPPDLIVDMLAAIISEALLPTASYEDSAIYVETELSIEGLQTITSYMLLIPGENSLEIVFKKVGLR